MDNSRITHIPFSLFCSTLGRYGAAGAPWKKRKRPGDNGRWTSTSGAAREDDDDESRFSKRWKSTSSSSSSSSSTVPGMKGVENGSSAQVLSFFNQFLLQPC